MSTTSRNDTLWNRISAPSVLLVAAALFAGVFASRSFESARPRSPALAFDPSRDVGQVRGLITMDPLEQAYAEVKAANDGQLPWEEVDQAVSARFALSKLAAEVADTLQADGSHAKVLVLLESVRGGLLSEDHERRLRARFATAAALVRESLYPRDSKRMSLLWFPDQTDPAKERGTLVPYEWYQRGTDSHSPYVAVVVAWIDEAAIERAPIHFGFELSRQLTAKVDELAAESLSQRMDVRWLAPTTSTVLRKMITGLERIEQDTRKRVNLKIVTPYATSPNVELPRGPGWGDEGFSVVRSVGTDDRLARLLVEELMLRIPELLPMHEPLDASRESASPRWMRTLASPLSWIGFVRPPRAGERVRVALITEQDSTYGQAWIANMEQARDGLAQGKLGGGRRPQLERMDFTVFPVFGWVDGMVREPRDKSDTSAAISIAKDYPAEPHQLDYLARLRDELQEESAFAAIGVFVTEEYDTLMILEALRPQFPGAVFFTTDLDARYLHPRHAPFTRNLIVASHFGLRPRPIRSDRDAARASYRDAKADDARNHLARKAPDFRDGYQSGVYRTVRSLALDIEPEPPECALIYEIGRSRIVALNAGEASEPRDEAASPERAPVSEAANQVQAAERDPGAASVAKASSAVSQPAEFQPPEAAPVWEARSLIAPLFASAVLALGVLVFGVRPRPLGAMRASTDTRTIHAFGAIVLFVIALLFAIDVASRVQRLYPAEPMFMFQGISAWPTFGLRLVMVALCGWALLTIPARLRRKQVLIARENQMDPGAKAVDLAWLLDWRALGLMLPASTWADAPKSWPRRTGQFLGCLLGLRRSPRMPRRTLDEVWRFFAENIERRWITLLRMFGYSMALYFVLGAFFSVAKPPPSPVRGEFAYLLDRASLFVSIIAFLMLLMLVMEATFFATRVIGRVVDADAVELTCGPRDAALDLKTRLSLARGIANSVDKLIWFPMIVLGLMIFARASIFDAWPWPTVLMLVFGLFFLMFLMCIVSMRHVCEGARGHAIDELSKARSLERDASKASALRDAMTDVADFTGGAFSPLLHHPMIRAMVFPLAAFGASFAFERTLLEKVLGAM